MTHIAAKRSDLITFLKVSEADCAVANAPETTLVVVHLRSVVHYVLSGMLLNVLVPVVCAQTVDDAWAKDDKHGDDAHYYKGLWKDQTDDSSEGEQTETWIWVVAMRRKAIECTHNV